MKKKKHFKFSDKYFGRLINRLFYSYMDKFTDHWSIVNRYCYLNNMYYMCKETYQDKENLETLNDEEKFTSAINELSEHIELLEFYLYVYNNLYDHITKQKELKSPFIDKYNDLMINIVPFRNKYNYLMRNKTPLNLPVLYLIAKSVFDEKTFKAKEKQFIKYLKYDIEYYKYMKKDLNKIKFSILYYKVKLSA